MIGASDYYSTGVQHERTSFEAESEFGDEWLGQKSEMRLWRALGGKQPLTLGKVHHKHQEYLCVSTVNHI